MARWTIGLAAGALVALLAHGAGAQQDPATAAGADALPESAVVRGADRDAGPTVGLPDEATADAADLTSDAPGTAAAAADEQLEDPEATDASPRRTLAVGLAVALASLLLLMGLQARSIPQRRR
ncbi:hypothetical protein D1122_14090 [Cereibacter sphaeroides]|uniref:hypothetical protein n=1 Tax=Cereibacter sphaeroides TaxID=1063 RepID=UPI000E5AD024|nr:hypothetical protein [Cereibacter sphaeroides]RHZ95565.1 hypothetical protein D1122_14090 [Cereibacter sphaeroides]